MQADKIVITIGDVSHAPELTALSVTTFRDTFGSQNRQEDMDMYIADEMNEEKLVGELRDNDNTFFLAWHDKEMIGYAKMRVNKNPVELKDANAIELERIYVLNNYHHKKIGAALMSQCLSHAVVNKHEVLWLGVWEKNYVAVRFYEQWGFELFGSHPFVLGSDVQTDVMMKKVL